jgi:TM2 domain-containing membrane protein YozV
MTYHHVSDVDTWGNPDRNYFVFVALSLVLGFIGADHFYLRSFGTGIQKLFVNMFTLGFWYFWDVLQITTEGEKIRKEGLSSPLDWIKGIGRGVFTDPKGQSGGAEYEANKSYIVYAFLAIFFGWLGADKFYLGQGWQGIAKVLSCFNIFLFLFGWMWVAWDAFHAFFLTDKIMKDGITAPMPYSMVFTGKTEPEVFKVYQSGSGPVNNGNHGFLDWIAKTFNFPSVPASTPWQNIYKELVAPLVTPQLVKAVETSCGLPPMPKIPTLAELPKPEMPKIPTLAELPKPEMPKIPTLAELPRMNGGAITDSGPGPAIAGVLTAIVLAGGLKGFYDFISAQYG